MDVTWLTSDDGRAAVATLHGVDPLRARAVLPQLSPQQIADALTQVRHRPADFPLELVTSDGVQQSTPLAVARRRAQRLAEAGLRRVIDAGCGIGVDAWAFAQAGLDVIAYEIDPTTAQVARANLREFGVEVRQRDVVSNLPSDTAMYVDPARRLAQRDAPGRPIRVHDPERWSPPWSWVLEQSRSRPVIARIRPGHRDLPDSVEWHCSSINRRLVDATVWFPPLARRDRRASVLDGDTWHEISGAPGPSEVGPSGAFIVDPDPAVGRSGLVGNLANQIGGRLLDPRLAFITTDSPPPRWAGRGMAIVEQAALKHVARTCRRHGIDAATLWARGFTTEPRTGLPQGQQGIIVAARVGDDRHSVAWVGRPL